MLHYVYSQALVWALLVALVGPARAQTQVETGSLDSSDTTLEGGEFVEEFVIQPTAGQALVVTLVSLDFDPYLIVAPPEGDPIEGDDLQGSKDVAQVVAQVDQPGTWTIRVTSYQPGETGAFVLLWRSVPADQANRIQPKQPEGTLNLTTLEPDGVMTAGEATRTFRGELTLDDKVLPTSEWFDLYVVEATSGETLTFSMKSTAFDTYLAVASPGGEVTENDDDENVLNSTNSFVEVQADRDGRWYVIATAAAPLLRGAYELTITRGS